MTTNKSDGKKSIRLAVIHHKGPSRELLRDSHGVTIPTVIECEFFLRFDTQSQPLVDLHDIQNVFGGDVFFDEGLMVYANIGGITWTDVYKLKASLSGTLRVASRPGKKYPFVAWYDSQNRYGWFDIELSFEEYQILIESIEAKK